MANRLGCLVSVLVLAVVSLGLVGSAGLLSHVWTVMAR